MVIAAPLIVVIFFGINAPLKLKINWQRATLCTFSRKYYNNKAEFVVRMPETKLTKGTYLWQ